MLDDSLSMGRTVGGLGSAELARRAVVALIGAAGPRDAVTRRRIRLEQLLLLLTRIPFVAAPGLAVARPVAPEDGAFGFAGAGA